MAGKSPREERQWEVPLERSGWAPQACGSRYHLQDAFRYNAVCSTHTVVFRKAKESRSSSSDKLPV
jgi:hypothetical protein